MNRMTYPTERQSKILNILINEFIGTAMPVSSGAVFDIGGFDVSCPTIRNEMAELTELGYLIQPHTSAGRVPAEKGYRFFVDGILEHKRQRRLKEKRDNAVRVKMLAEYISKLCSDLVVFIDESGETRHIGLNKVLNNPEFESRSSIVSFIEEVERFEQSFLNGVEGQLDIFIGSENPFFEKDDYSMIISKYDDGFISLVGPTRMNYRRNLNLL